EPHAAVGEHLVAALHQRGAEARHGGELRQVGQVLVVDGKVEIEDVVGDRRHAVIEVPLQIDDDRDAVVVQAPPVLDLGGEVQAAGVVQADDVHLRDATNRTSAFAGSSRCG